MAYSTQRATSDGTLRTLLLSIQFLDKSEIGVFRDDVPQVQGVGYVWATANSIQFPAVLPNGTNVLLKRTTDLSEPRHLFTQGAQFKSETLDENSRQLLNIAQEAKEGASLSEIFSPLDMHGNKLINVGVATDPGDAVSLGQYQADALGASVARNEAVAAASTATAAVSAVVANADRASTAATASEASAVRSETAASTIGGNVALAQAAATASQTYATNSNASAVGADSQRVLAEAAASTASAAAAIADTAGLQLGMCILGNRAQPFRGFAVDDGQELDRSMYPDFAAALDSGLFPVVSEATWQADPLQRACFVSNSSAGKFRMRDLNGASAGTIGGTFQRGSTLAAQLKRDQFQGHFHDYMAQGTNGGGGAAGAYSTILAGNTTYAYNAVAAPKTDGVNGTPRTGSETYPTHVTGAWMTRLFGLITPLGSAEASSLATAYASMASRVSAIETTVAQLLGVGQTLQNVKAARTIGTPYTNNTPRPIWVSVGLVGGAANSLSTLTVDGLELAFYQPYALNGGGALSAPVPVGSIYTIAGAASIRTWVEWR